MAAHRRRLFPYRHRRLEEDRRLKAWVKRVLAFYNTDGTARLVEDAGNG